MWIEDLADHFWVVLVAYLAVGLPLNFYLYHDVIDRRWRTFNDVRKHSYRYYVLASTALVLLVAYGALQYAAGDYKEGGAACLSCAIAVYGLYLRLRQVSIFRFFRIYLQRRATAIIRVYQNPNSSGPDHATRRCSLLFPDGGYKQGPVFGHMSAVFLDDNYPGEGPRVTWLRRTPTVKDWTELMVRTALWIRLAVIPSSRSFNTALRLCNFPCGAKNTNNKDASSAWTLNVVQHHFLTSGERENMHKQPEGLLKDFVKCVEGEQGTLATWRETLSLAPESEWSQALSEFPSDWTEGLEARGIAWEVYLALALHSAEPMGFVEPRRPCWHSCAHDSWRVPAFCPCWGAAANAPVSQAPITGGTRAPNELQQHVEELVRATLDEEGFVTPTALMAGFPQQASLTLPWMESVKQLAEIWHDVAESMTTEDISLERHLTEGVDLVVALALLLGANKSSFEFARSSRQGMKETLLERHKLIVLNRLQDDEAEKVLRTSLEQCLARRLPDTDIAQSRYSLGKLLQHRVSFVLNGIDDSL